MGRWKLRLRPNHLPAIKNLSLPELPPSITVDKVFEHYLVYLKGQLQAYIAAQYANGPNIWNTLFPEMEVILSTPNGWELTQQQRMRAAAQSASLVSGPESAPRIRFVSEAEVRFQVPLLGITNSQVLLGCCSLRYQEWMHRGMAGGTWSSPAVRVTLTQRYRPF
jgi:hypothetical protein